MLYMFTQENLSQYAVLSAMGTIPRVLRSMIFAQAGLCALIGTGLGIGLCGIAGELARMAGYPFRTMWFTPLVGGVMVLLVSVVAAALSTRPVMKLQSATVFAGDDPLPYPMPRKLMPIPHAGTPRPQGESRSRIAPSVTSHTQGDQKMRTALSIEIPEYYRPLA